MVEGHSDFKDRRDAAFAALADPTRRAIVERLSSGDAATISDLAAEFPISRQAVTKHLEVLEQAQLISSRKRGRERQFSLHVQALESVSEWIGEQERRWDDRLRALERHLSEEQ